MNANEKIRVLLVDDHEMVRRGLSVFLETFDDLELVGEASNGAEALQQCREKSPHVVLMDLMMPGMGGIEAIRRIKAVQPDVQIIAMTSFNEENLVHDALQNGAIGYLLKNTSIDALAEAIRAARHRKATLAPEAAEALVAFTQRDPVQLPELTKREKEVLTLMVAGLSNPQIAKKLFISRTTVKTHVHHILEKLNVSSRLEAVKLAMKTNLVEIDDNLA